MKTEVQRLRESLFSKKELRKMIKQDIIRIITKFEKEVTNENVKY